jgi:mutator protein MutT
MNAKQVVVGAAILDGDRLLAAQRTHPPALAGKWELPGGKVDAGESDEAALIRECREELGVDLQLGRRVGRDWPISDTAVMRVWLATIAGGVAECRDHAALRWLTLDELHGVDWLTPDLPIVEKLAGLMLELSSADGEVQLPGGNVGGATRVGSTVRRPTGPWTPAVHALLAHLKAGGLDAIPRVLGIDDASREILEFVPGDTADAHDPWPSWVWADSLLVQAAGWLKRFHVAVADFRPTDPMQWRFGNRVLAEGEIICHHDVSPYNVVVGFSAAGEPLLRCVIDWDVAGPGTPLDDLAFMAWNFLPCWGKEAHHPDAELVRRLQLLADTYGFSASAILDAIAPTFGSAVERIFAGAAAGDPGMQNLVTAGHAAQNRASLEMFVARLPRLQARLMAEQAAGQG